MFVQICTDLFDSFWMFCPFDGHSNVIKDEHEFLDVYNQIGLINELNNKSNSNTISNTSTEKTFEMSFSIDKCAIISYFWSISSSSSVSLPSIHISHTHKHIYHNIWNVIETHTHNRTFSSELNDMCVFVWIRLSFCFNFCLSFFRPLCSWSTAPSHCMIHLSVYIQHSCVYPYTYPQII